jgi:hypothetical protein
MKGFHGGNEKGPGAIPSLVFTVTSTMKITE